MKRRKKLGLVLLLALMLVVSPSISYAKTISIKVTTSAGLRVRKGATTSSTSVTTLKKGSMLNVDSSKVKGKGCSSGWYKITSGTYKNKYVCSNYVTQTTTGTTTSESSSSSKTSSSSETFKVEVNTSSKLTVRANTTTTSKKKGSLADGTVLTVSDTSKSGNGCSGNWYKIANGTYKGNYVCGAYTVNYSSSNDSSSSSNQVSVNEKYVKSCSGTISKTKAKSLGVSTSETFVEVDLSDQKIILYKNGKCLIKSDAVTGQAESKGGYKNAVDTRTGTFKIKYKETNHYFKSDDLWADYWMPFDGGIGLHDAKWRSVFGNSTSITGSHGCVNLPHTAAKIIYNNVSAGTKVIVHK